MEIPTSPPPARTRKRRSLPSRLLRLGVLALVLVGLSILAAPYLLRTAWARERIAHELSAAVGSRVEFGECAFSWTGGVLLRDLKIANPVGFPTERPRVELAELRGGVSWTKLLTGNYSLDLHAKGLKARVLQREDGTTNVAMAREHGEHPTSRPSSSPGSTGSTASEMRALLARLRVDVTLDDAEVELAHAKHGVLEHVRELRFHAKKDLGSGPLRAGFAATLASGRVAGTLTLDPGMVAPLRVELSSGGLDLERVRPLVDAFLPPGEVTALGGTFVGNLDLEIDPVAQRVRSRGKLRIDAPRLGGRLLRGAEWRASAWTLEPDFEVALGAGSATQSLEGLRLDLGFASLQGLDAGAATTLLGASNALGCAFRFDLARLGELGDLVPEDLRASEGLVTGRLAVAVPTRVGAWNDDAWRRTLRVAGEVATARTRVGDHVLEGYDGRVALENDVLTWSNADRPARLDGGAFTLALRSQLDPERRMPTETSVRWNDGVVAASAIPVLRYFVPLLSGLTGDSGVDFRSRIDTAMTFRGPLLWKEGSSVLEWLDLWAGDGALSLAQGGFTPSRQLAALLDFAGVGSRLTFEKLGGNFTLAQGFVATTLAQLDGTAAKIGMRGRTSLSGRIEYFLDVSSLLQGHRDGERIRKVLGGKPLEAGLAGTLTSPSLAMPDLPRLLLEGAASDLQKGRLPGLFDELFGKKKRG